MDLVATVASGDTVDSVGFRVFLNSFRRNVSPTTALLVITDPDSEPKVRGMLCGQNEHIAADDRHRIDSRTTVAELWKDRHLTISNALYSRRRLFVSAMTVDARDSLFQCDPFCEFKLERMLNKVVLSHEAMTVSDSDWNMGDYEHVVGSLRRSAVPKDWRSRLVINGGFVQGLTQEVAWIEFARWCFDARYGLGSDQSSLGIIAYEMPVEKIVLANAVNRWVAHGSGFGKDHFRDAYQWNSELCTLTHTATGTGPAIFHQWDRTSAHDDIVRVYG